MQYKMIKKVQSSLILILYQPRIHIRVCLSTFAVRGGSLACYLRIGEIREGSRKKNPEKLGPFDKPGGGGQKKKKKRQTSILEKYFFSEHVESF